MKITNPILDFKSNRDLSFLFLAGYCSFAAISIAATRILIVPFIVLWLLRLRTPNSDTSSLNKGDGVYDRIKLPIILWVLIGAVSSIAGVDFANSIDDVLKSGFYFFFPFAIVSLLSTFSLEKAREKVFLLLSLLCLSQGFAALRSIISATIHNIDLGMPGALTESGQLVLTIPLILALVYSVHNNTGRTSSEQTILGAIAAAILITLNWKNEIFPNHTTPITIFLSITLAAIVYRLSSKSTSYLNSALIKNSFIATTVFVLMISTLVINLKRGPWLAVGLELIILGLIFSRKLALWTIATSTIAFLLPPVQSRILDSIAHFSIIGGRQAMWEIGIELSKRFPLGLGIENARFMQKLDPLIPDTHRHMHSNLLNILVETGWLGLAIFLILAWTIFKIGLDTYKKLKTTDRQLAYCTIAMTIALLGWQVAGLVEYNYGDGEIRMITLFYLGIILYAARYSATDFSSSISRAAKQN